MKSSKLTLVSALGVVVLLFSLVYAANYAHRLTVAGSEIWRIDNDGSFQNQSSFTTIGPVKFGNNETGSSATVPTTTTGSNFGTWVPVYNVGAAVVKGEVLISSNTGTGYVRGAPATENLTNIVGVAAEAIASGAKGWMVPRGGGYAVALGTGTIAIGDILTSSSPAAGYFYGDGTPTTANAGIAIAMSANVSGSGGNVLVIMK